MNKPVPRAFYEFLEVIVPGGFFCACLMLIYKHPAATNLGQWSLGALGVFLIVSVAVGHLVQTLSSTIELWFSRAQGGGMPIDWVRAGKRKLLSATRITELEQHLKAKLGLPADFTIASLDMGAWYYTVRQMHAMVLEGRPMSRINELEAGYAINRALACAVFALSVLYLLNDPFADPVELSDSDFTRLYVGVSIFMAGILTLYRMQRYGVQYALELVAQFVLLPSSREIERAIPQESAKADEVAA